MRFLLGNTRLFNSNDLDFYKDKRVLITGHTGFKGTWLTMWLHSLGAKVYGYSLPAPDFDTERTMYRIVNGNQFCEREVLGDIRDYDNLQALFADAQPEVVFHLAAQPIVSEGYANPRYTFETNVMGTVNVLECIRNTPSVKSAVIITTDKVYNESKLNFDNGYCETDELNGRDPYSNSKSCADIATQCYYKSFLKDLHIPVSIFRAGNVIGGGDFAKNRIIPDAIRAWENKETLYLRCPNAIRPYQHVLEPLYVYMTIGMLAYNDGISDSFNIGPDASCCATTEQLIDTLSLFCFGNTLSVECNPSSMHEAAFLKLNNDHLRSLGWEPKWNLTRTVGETGYWYESYVNCNQNIVEYTFKQIKDYEDCWRYDE